ncbi:synaptotagmin-like protein 2 isoform X5 [Leptonychotes weddellii]|uniref:Synaptotagmin-like protein 2 n=1 Tax=Leptonychotes weddellii TaxID=9713 RepID=A0A7F8QVA4_LEPWE|nr:synaptotagmin-like protein 2 isoform X5 [Leptonychotes weddellii]
MSQASNTCSVLVNQASTVMDTSQENTRKSTVSPAKQRKNPFNSSKLPEDHLSQQTKSEPSQNGKAGFSQTSKEGELSESKENSSIPDTSSQNLEKPKQTFPGSENGSPVKAPIPKARKILPKSHELKQEDNQSFPQQRTDSLSTRQAPRGILKRNSSSSSTDSETVRFHQNLEPKSKIVSPGLTIHERISEKEHSLEDDSSNSLESLKHVRFSAVKDELPQSPGLSRGWEVGEFSVLESDRLRNGTEDNVDVDEFWNDPKPSQYRKPLPLHQSASSPSASKNGTQQPMTSGSFPMNGHHSPLEVLTPRPESVENSSTTNEHKAKPSELSRLESELSKSPADGLSCVEPEPSQVPDHSSRDRQQGKPPLLKALKARTSSHSGPFATEIRKTTDDSISKVLDWFNRSSHSEDNKSSLQHPQGIELKEETESPIATALVRDDTILKENGSKALLPTKVKLMPMESDSTFQGKVNTLPSRTCQNNNVNIKPKSINLSQQGKEGPAIFQPCEIYGPNQGSKTMDSSQVSKNRGEGNRVLTPISNNSYSALKGPDAEDQVPCNIKDVGSLDEEEPKLHVYEKNRGNSEVNFDSIILVKKTSLKENMKAERESKGGDPHILKASLEPENIESLHGATKNKSWEKPEVQLKEAGEVPKNQVQREKYKRVSERISFWEGEKAAAKLTHKEPTLSCNQGQPSTKAYQPVKSMDSLSTGQCEYNQVTSKQVVLDENGHTAHLSSFYSSNKPKETRPQISGPSKNYPSVDQSGSEEEPSPVLKTLERSAARKMPSKSLEDISSDSPSENKDQAKVDNLPEELVRSAEDDQKADQEPDTNECIPGISTVPSQPDNPFSHPDKLKRMSKSVPAFLQDESDDRETDTTSESSYQLSRHKKSPSSLTNLSSSSGMTSLSSVSGSVMSVYSGDFGNLEVKGNIQFAIDYVDSLKELHVFVAQCKDLAAADVKKQRSDPYVKTYLLPDKGKMGKKKTLVVKKTLNPVYNEILRYKIEKQILKTQKLNLSVWHRDTFKRNSFLGEVELDLETWDWDNKQNKQLKWYPLKRKTAPVALEAENRGEMKLALQYVPEPIPGKKLPTTGEVHIWVKECLDLPQLRGSHLNSFVKCIILPDTSRKSRQKTRAVGKTTSPVFNHTMVYDGFRPEDLTEACVELTVWDHYKLTNQFLGGLRIGFGTGKSYGTEVDWMDSTSEEVALWEKMVKSPNTWIEATLPLRMLLIAKISK